MKTSIYQTTVMRHISDSQYRMLLEYLVNNRFNIVINEDRLNILVNTIPSLPRNLMSDFFNIIQRYEFKYFCAVTTAYQTKVPEPLLFNHFNLDICDLKNNFSSIDFGILNSIPNYKDKIIINMSKILNKEQNKILDVASFEKYLVRSLCSRSYNNFKELWISGSFLKVLTQLYSLPLANNIARLYNLEMNQMMLIATVFAYYFLYKCLDTLDLNVIKTILIKYEYLGNAYNIKTNLDLIDEILSKISNRKYITITDLPIILKEISLKRLSNMDMKTLLVLSRTFNYDNLVSLISLEYPGYWLYNLFCVSSGERSNLFFVLQKLNLLKENNLFLNNLLHDNNFIQSFEPI